MPASSHQLIDRYLPYRAMEPLLKMFVTHESIEIKNLGLSVKKVKIPVVRLGTGKFKILCWSQMHGNESTTTKMLLDICEEVYLGADAHWPFILSRISLVIIPMLNPDGAATYTRENANGVDLNRDAKALTQPESKILRNLFDLEAPDLCLNLHGQRSIYGLRKHGKTAAISFLAPAADKLKTITPARREAMHLICGMNSILQEKIPNQVGRYDDTFNQNCVGDTFTNLGCPSILFEAGQLDLDYNRNNTRALLLEAFKGLLQHIAGLESFTDSTLEDYEMIPQNEVIFDDLLLKAVVFPPPIGEINIRAHYREVLEDNRIKIIPELVAWGKDLTSLAHQILDCQNTPVTDSTLNPPELRSCIEEYLVKNFSR